MDIRVGDILTMKKAHPCGEKRWEVLRTGADFRLKCLGCGHELMTPRFKAEKNIRSVERISHCHCRDSCRVGGNGFFARSSPAPFTGGRIFAGAL